MKFYTLTIKTPRNKKIKIKHCIDIGGTWFRLVKYRNGSDEHEDILDMDEEIGWDYEPLNLPGSEWKITDKKEEK